MTMLNFNYSGFALLIELCEGSSSLTSDEVKSGY
jgi:hypothetical protein